MRRFALLWVAGLAVPGTCLGGQDVEADTLTDSTVQAAVRAIVDELYRRRDPRHDWDPVPWTPARHGQSRQVGGHTPLVRLALLPAAESSQTTPRPANCPLWVYRSRTMGQDTICVFLGLHSDLSDTM